MPLHEWMLYGSLWLCVPPAAFVLSLLVRSALLGRRVRAFERKLIRR